MAAARARHSFALAGVLLLAESQVHGEASAGLGPLGGIDGFLLSAHKRRELAMHPLRPLIFVKTHKTGSSSISTMLLRMADWRNLTVMLPCNHATTSLNYPQAFPGSGYPQARHQFDVIASHAVLSPHAMRAYARHHLTPLIFTVLREPFSRLSSALNWYHHYPGSGAVDALIRRLERARHLPLDQVDEVRFINNQAHDLGWYGFEGNARSTRHDRDGARVRRWLQQLDSALDVAILLERLPEGLALLRHRIGAYRVAPEELAAVRQKSNRDARRDVRFSAAQRRRLMALNGVDSALYHHYANEFKRQWADAPADVRSAAAVIRTMHEELGDGSGGCRLHTLRNMTAPRARARAHGGGAKCPTALLTDVEPYLRHHRQRAHAYCRQARRQCHEAYGALLRACG